MDFITKLAIAINRKNTEMYGHFVRAKMTFDNDEILYYSIVVEEGYKENTVYTDVVDVLHADEGINHSKFAKMILAIEAIK